MTFNSLAGNQHVYWKKGNFYKLGMPLPYVLFECLIILYYLVNVLI